MGWPDHAFKVAVVNDIIRLPFMITILGDDANRGLQP